MEVSLELSDLGGARQVLAGKKAGNSNNANNANNNNNNNSDDDGFWSQLQGMGLQNGAPLLIYNQLATINAFSTG